MIVAVCFGGIRLWTCKSYLNKFLPLPAGPQHPQIYSGIHKTFHRISKDFFQQLIESSLSAGHHPSHWGFRYFRLPSTQMCKSNNRVKAKKWCMLGISQEDRLTVTPLVGQQLDGILLLFNFLVHNSKPMKSLLITDICPLCAPYICVIADTAPGWEKIQRRSSCSEWGGSPKRMLGCGSICQASSAQWTSTMESLFFFFRFMYWGV